MAQARIRSQQVQMDVCYRDGMSLVQHGLANIVRISQSDELRYALDACEWLVDYGERLMQEKAQAKVNGNGNGNQLPFHTVNRAAILDELKGLYAKALGSAPAIVEVQAEPAAEAVPMSDSKPSGR